MSAKYTKEFIRRLRNIEIRHYNKLIHDQSQKWLIENFSQRANKYPVNVSMLMRNIIWQNRERIISGKKPPLKELIRTFWYMYIKPTLSRCESLSDKPDNQYRQLIAILADMIKEHDLMRYKDIGFRDDRKTYRKVGAYANIILFAEKAGHHEFLTDIADKYKISILALGGKPSIMNIEYFVDDLKKHGVHLNRSFYLFSIVDFDPHGHIVRDSFIEGLEFYGVRNITLVDLVHPDMLTPQEIEMSKYRLSQKKRDEALNQRWLKRIKQKHYTNMKYLLEKKKEKRKKKKKKKAAAILYGLEAESVSTKRITEKLKELMLPILGKKEHYLKEWELEDLNERIRRLILRRMTGG